MHELPEHISRLAHDLRGPLAPLQTAAYLLRREDLDSERRSELAGIVERQTTRLSRMIDELGEWIRAGQSRLAMRRERTELELLLDLAGAATSGPDASHWTLQDGLDRLPVDGDPQRLAQMLGTLIAHARHRDDGTGLQLEGRREGDRLLLSIVDHGPPMPESARAALFETADPAPYDEGLGLRLLIAHAVARSHGGRLQARGADSGGTQYLVELPLGTPAATEAS